MLVQKESGYFGTAWDDDAARAAQKDDVSLEMQNWLANEAFKLNAAVDSDADRVTKEFDAVGYTDMTTAQKTVYLFNAAAWRDEKKEWCDADADGFLC